MLITSLFTISKNQKEPPFIGESNEDHNQHEVEHDPLTHHPAEGREEEILHQCCHKPTSNLNFEPNRIL